MNPAKHLFSDVYWISLSTILAVIVHVTYPATVSRSELYDDGVTNQLQLRMPSVIPSRDDQYLCTSALVPETDGLDDWYITNYQPLANMSKVHHMLLYGCAEPYSQRPYYECTSVCSGGSAQRIIYAWAKQAPPLALPRGVGYRVGGRSGLRYLVLQLHYLHKLKTPDSSGLNLQMTRRPQPFEAGVFLVMAYYGTIPAHKRKVHLDISCKYSGPPIRPFAFRTHAHTLGRSIIAWHIAADSQDVKEIGRGNPQWPQTFYPTKKEIVIRQGDFLLARCIYDSMDRSRVTSLGQTHADEMCNFYIMFQKKNTGGRAEGNELMCGGNHYPRLWDRVRGMGDLDYLPPHPPTFTNKPTARSRVGTKGSQLALVQSWHVDNPLGQVGGVAVDMSNHLLVFHRSERTWGASTFDADNRFRHAVEGPIPENTVLHVDPASGQVLSQWGAGLFYLPHGIAVDSRNGDVWVTDVGSHQVMRFTKGQWGKPSLVLGEKLVPGTGKHHFCKPADVAINDKGEVFIADGYCNSRVVKLSPEGRYLKSWGSGGGAGDFVVVHSVAVVQSEESVCVADRENSAIECFDFEGGFKRRYAHESFKDAVYAIAWHPRLKRLIGVTSQYGYSSNTPHGFTLDINTGEVGVWAQGHDALVQPHDLAISRDGANVFVGEIGPNRVRKFHVVGLSSMATANPSGASGQGKKKLPDFEKKGISVKPPVKKNDTTYSMPHLATLTDGKASLVIGIFLVVPVVLILSIVILIRLSRSGRLPCVPRPGTRNRRYGPLFKERNGFQPLNQDESDMESERLTNDNSPTKAKA